MLPSYYREGTPRSLLEALSVGRPIITTDMPGCIDTVVNNKNGFIINPKDSSDLANKMRKFINLPINEKIEFGKESRKIAEKKFDEKIVIKRYTEKINLALSR